MLLLQSVAFSDSHTHLHLQAPLLLCSKHCSCLSPKRIQMSFSRDGAFIFRFFLPIAAYIGCPSLWRITLGSHHTHGILGWGWWCEVKDICLPKKTSFIFILLVPLGPRRQVYVVSAFPIQLTLPLSAVCFLIAHGMCTYLLAFRSWIRKGFYLSSSWNGKKKRLSAFFCFSKGRNNLDEGTPLVVKPLLLGKKRWVNPDYTEDWWSFHWIQWSEYHPVNFYSKCTEIWKRVHGLVNAFTLPSASAQSLCHY